MQYNIAARGAALPAGSKDHYQLTLLFITLYFDITVKLLFNFKFLKFPNAGDTY